jgi:cytochrome P450
MEDMLTSDDPRYREIFDVAAEAENMGNATDLDLNDAMNALRERGSVLKGSLRELLGINIHSPFEHDLPTYSVLSFKACDQAFRDNKSFTSFAYNDMPAIRSLGPIVLNRVGEEHIRLRATAQLMFMKPKTMSWWRSNWIDNTVNTLLDRIEKMDAVDLNFDLCARLPMQVVTLGVGLDGSKALTFREHLLKALGGIHITPEQQRISYGEVEQMLLDLVAERRRVPADDVISGLMSTEFKMEDGSTRDLTDDEVLGFCRLLLLAGGGTTWRQLGITIHALLSHYHFWEALREDRTLVADAVEEAARWNATDPTFPRLVLEDTEIEGVVIPANHRVDVGLGAANRDPARWDNPDAFDIFRPRKQHLTFGIGPHHCLGQYVARQEMIVAINGLLDRFPNLRLDPAAPPQRLIGGIEQRGMSAIPVTLR